MVLLDAGHGGYDGKKYHCIASGKLYKHGKKGYHFNSGFFYEGVFNRKMLNLIVTRLERYEVPYKIISDELLDLNLPDRVDKANYYHRLFPNAFLISLHANASPLHNARGYEVYSSRGQTKADRLATLHYSFTAACLDNRIKFRSDTWSDGDPDKEANFYVLKRTTCPAILIEHLFFDQKEDVRLLMDEEIQNNFADATAFTAKTFLDEIR